MIDKRLIFFEGKHVSLKVLSQQDISESGWVGWFNDEAMSQYNQHHYFPNTFEQQHEILESLRSKNKIQLGIINRKMPDTICGVVTLKDINWIHRHAEISGIQDKEVTNKSPELFIESWSIMLRHAFEQLGLVKVYGGTFHPHVAGALKRIFNFEKEGIRKRQVFKNGQFFDVTLVAVFNDTISYPEL